MQEKSQNIAQKWVDPDDAPELTDEFFDKGTWRDGEKVVTKQEAHAILAKRRGRPVGTTKTDNKVAVKLRIDPDTLAAFKATGRGWQTRVNEAMREWVKTHPSN